MNSRIIFADERGKFEIELFQPSEEYDSGPSIMLNLTPPRPQTEHYAMDAADARLIAAALMDYADMQDAVADTGPIPKIEEEE